MFIKRFGIKKTLLFLGIVINTIMIGGITYATVQITSPASSEWCGPKKPGCSKILSVHLSNNPENMSCSNTSTYYWATTAWGSCSASCGGGTQGRAVVCKNSNGTTVPDGSCASVGIKPTGSQSCNNNACSVAINGVCSTTANTCTAGTPSGYAAGSCGGNQTWNCNGINGGTNISCRRANSACFTYSWQVSGFGACSVSCGTGTQYQTVQCIRDNDRSVVGDADCTNAGLTKPNTTQVCNAGTCTPYNLSKCLDIWVYVGKGGPLGKYKWDGNDYQFYSAGNIYGPTNLHTLPDLCARVNYGPIRNCGYGTVAELPLSDCGF